MRSAISTLASSVSSSRIQAVISMGSTTLHHFHELVLKSFNSIFNEVSYFRYNLGDSFSHEIDCLKLSPGLINFRLKSFIQDREDYIICFQINIACIIIIIFNMFFNEVGYFKFNFGLISFILKNSSSVFYGSNYYLWHISYFICIFY